jgi:hypothetical protein
MTDLHKAAQQALNALSCIEYGMCGITDGPSDDTTMASMDALRAALAQPAPEPETCTWHQDGDSDSGVYATSCGHYFNLEDGTPEDNEMSHCCYCGKRLAQELITEGGDD